jgi:hypothetical protein
MIWLVNFYLNYRDYLSFIFLGIFVSLFYYFFISTFLEMSMDLLKKSMQDKHNFLSTFFSTVNTFLFIIIIYYFGQIYVSRGANSLGILFLLIAWSFAVIQINKRFDTKPWFSFLLFNAAWLGILLIWLQK